MYVLEHSRKWWHYECKIKCPDCETALFQDNHYYMDIESQELVVWKRAYACKYDLQYRAIFKCNHCGCIFKAWSHVIKDVGPTIGTGVIGDVTIRNWGG